jgi:hypothetical protein
MNLLDSLMWVFEIFSADAARFLKTGGIMLYSTLALGALLAAVPAHAQSAGDPCDKTLFGETKLATDQTDIIACLYTDNTKKALVWKSAYSGNNGGTYVMQQSGAQWGCLSPNPIVIDQANDQPQCACPSGYVATPVSYSQNFVYNTSTGGSSTPTQGYTCVQGSSPLNPTWHGGNVQVAAPECGYPPPPATCPNGTVQTPPSGSCAISQIGQIQTLLIGCGYGNNDAQYSCSAAGEPGYWWSQKASYTCQ